MQVQLEKGLVTCMQGEKNLNDLLSGQKENLGKEGIGFNSELKKKSKKKKKNKKKMPTPSYKAIVFVKEGESAKVKEVVNKDVGAGSSGTISQPLEVETVGTITSSSGTVNPLGAHNNFAGKYNPSYVLMKARDGHVYAKYVGTSYSYDYHWAIWVPKTLVTNKRGPIQKWGPGARVRELCPLPCSFSIPTKSSMPGCELRSGMLG